MPDASRVADGSGRARFGHRDNQVGLDRMLSRESPPDLDPGGMHTPPGNRRVRPSQVDVFEQAALGFGHREMRRAQPVLVDRDELTRLDLTHERRSDDVQRGGLGSHHPATSKSPQDEGTHTLAHRGRRRGVLVHEYERKRATQGWQHIECRLLEGKHPGGRRATRSPDRNRSWRAA